MVKYIEGNFLKFQEPKENENNAHPGFAAGRCVGGTFLTLRFTTCFSIFYLLAQS